MVLMRQAKAYIYIYIERKRPRERARVRTIHDVVKIATGLYYHLVLITNIDLRKRKERQRALLTEFESFGFSLIL